MAEGQGSVGLWAGEKSPGWSGKLPARAREVDDRQLGLCKGFGWEET